MQKETEREAERKKDILTEKIIIKNTIAVLPLPQAALLSFWGIICDLKPQNSSPPRTEP
jgi:hypothetical protein